MNRAAFFGLWVAAAALWAQPADLAVTNARIYTVNPKQPTAFSMAVRGGKIVAVGADVSKLIGPGTKVIDAHGLAVLPGLIDSHGHVRGLGTALETLDLRGMKSEKEIADAVREAAKTAKPGKWILGRAWDQNLWAVKEFPTARSISDAAPNNPVALTRVDGHAIWANKQALDAADVNAAPPDPAGGRVMRCAKLGMTTVHDAGVPQSDIDAYHSLQAKGLLPMRVYAMIAGSSPDLQAARLAKGPEIGDYVTVRSIKLYGDGAPGSRGASMIEPDSDDKANRGLAITDRAGIRAVAEKAVAKGFQVNTHAIGDGANRAALDAYGDVLKGPNDKRFRIEHAQVIAPEDFAKFKKYSVIASMQPTHATSDMTREEALRSWTIEGAYAAFEEKTKGSPEPGKLADFIMLSDDVMTMPDAGLWKTHVKLTVVGGKIVYQE